VSDSGSESTRSIAVGNVGPDTDWRRALEGCETVIHLAGQVPRKGVEAADFRSVNDAGTARLVEQAIEAGTRRFVFLSSVSAVIENDAGFEIDEQTPATASLTPYGQSKRAAEAHVVSFARAGRVGISIRPPLVYAADAKGKWMTLQRLAGSGLPLPFGMVHNRRSLIAVENLVDALVATAAVAPTKELSGAYFVADASAVSVREIFTWLREGLGLPSRLVPVPVGGLRRLLRLSSLGSLEQRLFGDLAIDSSLFCKTFDWTPGLHPSDAIRKSGAEFRSGLRS
jgi:UDP-glucose 4-epimerase